MKFLCKVMLVLLCLGLLSVPAWATAGVDSVQVSAAVSDDGSCYVTLRFQLRLEQEEKLSLSLPAQAKEIRLNGKYKTPAAQGQQLVLQLPQMGAGVHTVEISFRLDHAVTEKNGALWLEVPLLTGFPYPVENFSCAVALPAEPKEQPSFVSGYHGESIFSSLDVRLQGNTVYASSKVTLKDRETLLLRYRADREMFPHVSTREPLLGGWEAVMVALLAAAAVYYLVALLPVIPRRVRSFSPPDGLAAGDLGTCLTGCGMDLTMMVFSWAQLGYLTIETDGRGKVTLLRRMEMGTERSSFENKCFGALFGQRQRVDGQGLHYALLCRKMAAKSPLLRQIYRSRSGNPRIVRILGICAGACSGVLLSQGVYTAGAGTVLLALAMAALCSGLSFMIQSGGRCIPLGNKLPLWAGLLCAGLWVGVGYLMNNLTLAVVMVAIEAIIGLAAAVGGRRSEAGQQYVAQIRGLRYHLTRSSVFEMQQCLEKNPAYFFELMPYALALGVEKPFARRFGKVIVAECSYLDAPIQGELTPYQWAVLLRHVADRLNRRQRRLKFEKLLEQAENIVKTK